MGEALRVGQPATRTATGCPEFALRQALIRHAGRGTRRPGGVR